MIAALTAVAVITGLIAGVGGSAQAAAPGSTNANKAVAPPQGWRHAFAQGFTGTKLNTKVWGTCYPWASPSGCTNYGNTSDPEQEWYKPAQIQVKDGVLGLVARRTATAGTGPTGQPKEYACRSGMVTTFPSLRFKYGFIRVTARVPFGKGLWSALWLDAANEKWPPEVDILEHWGTQAQSRVFLHPVGLPEQEGKLDLPNADKGWHTFTLSWTSTRLTWWFDGQQVYTTTTGIPEQAMYLIMNLAVDDATPGGCSGTFDVKAVNIWVPRAGR